MRIDFIYASVKGSFCACASSHFHYVEVELLSMNMKERSSFVGHDLPVSASISLNKELLELRQDAMKLPAETRLGK